MAFKDLSIKRKFFAASFLTSLAVLLLTGVILLGYEFYSYALATSNSLEATASVIAANSRASLVADDRRLASDILDGLTSAPEITSAALFTRDGKIYATYPATLSKSALPTNLNQAGVHFRTGSIRLMRSVTQGGRVIGTLYLEADLRSLYDELWIDALLLLTAIGPCALVVYLLAGYFQREITLPVLELAKVAKSVSSDKDYTVRATTKSEDELGALTAVFNSMLDQIQASHVALRESEGRLSAIFNQAGAGIAQADLNGRFVMVNDRYCEIVDRTREELLRMTIAEITHRDDQESNTTLLQSIQLKGEPATMTKRYVRPNGSSVWVRNSLVALRNQRGAVTATLAVVQDITDYMVATSRSRQMAAIVESTDDAIISKDLSGTIKSWNRGAELLFGYSAEEAIGQSIMLVVPADHAHEEPVIIERIRRGDRIEHYETVRRHKSGHRVNVSITVSPVKDATGKVTGASKIARDITKQKQDQLVLAARARLAAVGAEIAGALSRRDETEGLQACAEALGRHIEGSIVRIWTTDEIDQNLVLSASAGLMWDFGPGADRLRFGQVPIGLIAETREPLFSDDIENDPAIASLEWPRNERLASFAGYPLVVDGQTVGVLAIFSRTMLSGVLRSDLIPLLDAIAQFVRRKRSEQALLSRERQMRLITDSAPIMLAQLDRDYRYLFVNRTYAHRYGFEPDQIIGRLTHEIVGLETHQKAKAYVDLALAGEQVEYELQIDNSGPGARWTHAIYTPEKNAFGEVVGLVAVHTDITHRKEAEIQLAKARDDALAASRAKDDFLAALSHELRTPLNPVLLLASDAAGNPDLPDPIRTTFATIAKNVQLEARLIDDLLDLTRIARGKMSLETETLDVHSILRDALETLQSEVSAKHLSLTFALNATKHRVSGDRTRLQQIYWNLLKNAVKFTPEGGSITVATRDDHNEQILIEIRDTGIGMTGDELERAFVSFSQGNHARAGSPHRFGGLGLGLAISRMLVEMHAGRIWASSKGHGEGTTLFVQLPLASGQEVPAVNPVNPPTRSSVEANNRRILLVEDHAPTRQAIVQLLSRRNYRVSMAASVAEAVELAAKETFDLVVSDIGLPDGDGYELMVILRERYGLKGIALSGFGMEEDISRSKAAGFIIHLTKPVNVRTLESALASIPWENPATS